jgi:hypothetical protein
MKKHEIAVFIENEENMQELKNLLHDKFDWNLNNSLTKTGEKLVEDTLKALEIIKQSEIKSNQSNVIDSFPTEEQVLKTIFDCVFIRGIELEDYKRNFTNEQSGLYNAIVKLFNCHNPPPTRRNT